MIKFVSTARDSEPWKEKKPYGDIDGIITLTHDDLVVRNPASRKPEQMSGHKEKGRR